MRGDILLALSCVFTVGSGQRGQEMPVASGGGSIDGGFDMTPLTLSWNQASASCPTTLHVVR